MFMCANTHSNKKLGARDTHSQNCIVRKRIFILGASIPHINFRYCPSLRNGISAETSKTLLILRFLATGAEETNESDFGGTSFFTTSSCKLEVSAKGL